MRRFALSSRLIGSVLPVLAAGVLSTVMAVGDVTISVVDATPTARHDGTLPGIGETIFSADIFVHVPATDAWFSGGLGLLETTRQPGVILHYTTDPNTGVPVFTSPGYANDAEMLSTFVSYPLSQLQRARFVLPAQLAGGYWGAPSPNMTPVQLEVSYYEHPTSFQYGSGYTQRVSIDISNSAYAGQSVYVSTEGPVSEGDTRLVGFESAATTQSGEQRIQQWSFYAVPEPAPAFVFALALFVSLLRPRTGPTRQQGAVVITLAISTSLFVYSVQSHGQTLTFGEQQRVDSSGRRPVSELAAAGSNGGEKGGGEKGDESNY